MSITRADNTVGFIADAATPAGAVGFCPPMPAINGGLKISVDTSVPPIYTLNYTALDGTGAAKANRNGYCRRCDFLRCQNKRYSGWHD